MNMIDPIIYESNDIKLEMYPEFTIIFYHSIDNVFYTAIGYNDLYSVDLDFEDNVSSLVIPAKCSKDCFSIDSDKFRKNSFNWFRKRTNIGLSGLEHEILNSMDDNTIYPFDIFVRLTESILHEQHLKFNSHQQAISYFNLGKIIDPDILKSIIDTLYNGFVYANQEAVPTTTKGENSNEENNI